MTINDAYKKTVSKLNVAFIENPSIEAEFLLLEVLKIDRKTFLLEKDEKRVTLNELEKLDESVLKRLEGKSIAGITGKKYFYDSEFAVNGNVLIPRPETELLIDIIKGTFPCANALEILDIGTGSCIIPIVLSGYFTNSNMDAVDISLKALEIAKRNVDDRGLKNINLINVDIFSFVPGKKYDLIVSNPPYIPSAEVDELLKSKRLSDPPIALDGGNDGLKFYREIAGFAGKFLKDSGVLVIEHGMAQRNDIISMFDKNEVSIDCFDDLSGIDRVIRIKKKAL